MKRSGRSSCSSTFCQGIVTRMNDGETIIADQRSDVTILFADLVAFTKLTSRLSAGDLVHLLNSLFSEFDRLALSLGVEKIKTLGDSYMVAGGLPEARADHAHAVADMALAMIATVERMNFASCRSRCKCASAFI